MSYSVFARKYRPQTFEEVVGQEPVATTLRNAITENRVGHAYLFAGPRGVGKTSMARIFAKALNCVKGPTPDPCMKCDSCRRIADGSDSDVIEMDAASNRQVEDARTLRESVHYAPMRSRFKIYIIDEAHMLTKDAFNTLLKTLEEPPPHVKFFFATTEPEKLLDTIRSRCQQFDFRRITAIDVIKRLQQICRNESIKVQEEALMAIARAAGGAMRDAQSMLDQIAAYTSGEVTVKDVHQLTGAVSTESCARIVSAIGNADVRIILEELDRIFSGGVEPDMMHRQLLDRFRSLLILKACGAKTTVLDLTAEEREILTRESEQFTLAALLGFVQSLLDAARRFKEGAAPRVVLETTLIRMASGSNPAALDVRAAKSAETPEKSVGVKKKSEVPRPALMNQEVEATPAPAPVVPPAADEPAGAVEEEPVPAVHTVEIIRARWSEVLEKIKEIKMTVSAYLREARVESLNGDEVVIAFGKQYNFHKSQLDHRDNRAIVESALERAFGRKLSMRCVLEDGAAPTAVPQETSRSEARPEPAAAAPVRAVTPSTDTILEPGVQRVMEIFEGKIVSLED